MAIRKFLYVDDSEGFHVENDSTDELSIGKLTLAGVSGVAIDAGGQLISNVADPVNAGDAVNLGFLASYVQGLAPKKSVKAAQSSALPAHTYANGTSGVGATITANANGAISSSVFDGVTVSDGDEVLVWLEGSGSSANNGIYEVTDAGDASNPFVLTRRSDSDEASELLQAYLFAREGSLYGDHFFVNTTDGSITVGTTGIEFVDFGATNNVTAGAGIDVSSNKVSIDLDTAASAQGAGNGGGSSGLEFDVSGDGGQLRAAVNASGGLQRTATGLGILLDNTPTTLASSSSGIKVVGVPSQFNINGSPVSSNFSASNASSLVDGGSADGLHNHSNVYQIMTAGVNISKGAALYLSGSDTVGLADRSNAATARVIGFANANATSGNDVPVVSSGIITGVLSSATPNTPYFLSTSGAISATLPAVGSGHRLIGVGWAVNATDLWINLRDYAKR